MSLEKMRSRQGKALVVVNGELELEYLESIASQYAIILCADGAANKLKGLEILPDIMVGDFDSVEPETLDYFRKKSVEIVQLQPEKDFSDTHVAVELAMERGYQHIDIIGGFGGRWDHSIANFNLLYYGFENNCDLRLISEKNRARIYGRGTHNLPASRFYYWSCFAIFDDATVSIHNMKYPIEQKKILRGESIGLSNEFLETDGKLIIEKGSVIVIQSKKD